MRRVLTALVLIPSVLFVIFSGPPWMFTLVVCLMAFLCFEEYAMVAAAQGARFPKWAGHAMGLAFLLVSPADWRLLVIFALLAMLLALRVSDLTQALPQASALVLGLLYIYGAWRCAIPLRELSPWWLFFAVGLNWIGDTAALVCGRSFGKHKLAPVVSPKKTWEGAIGSLVCCAILGAVLLAKSPLEFPALQGGLISMGTCVAGQVGDLAESALKRGAGVKDSGHSLPGHGGWLDRLDSTLFTLPAVAILLSFLS